MPTAATDVGNARTGAQPRGQTVGERQDDVDQCGVGHFTAHLGHQRVKPRVVAVGQAAAGSETADDLLLDLSQQRDELRHSGQVVGAGGARQCRRMFARQPIGLCRGVVVHDAGGGHPAEPLPHVAFVEPGGVGDLGTGGRREVRHRVEQSGLVADAQQQGHAGTVDSADDPFGELLRGRILECRHKRNARPQRRRPVSGELCKFPAATWCE